MARVSIIERLKRHIEVSETLFWNGTPCWIWTACKTHDGYGRIQVRKHALMAHRVSYEEHIGPIPEGLTLDHLCRHRACINPLHSDPVTMEVNILRGLGMGALNAVKTHCKRGHPLSGENLYLYSDGRRSCQVCRRAYHNADYCSNRAANGFKCSDNFGHP